MKIYNNKLCLTIVTKDSITFCRRTGGLGMRWAPRGQGRWGVSGPRDGVVWAVSLGRLSLVYVWRVAGEL